jgi:carboxymethylenebutenolidase
MNKKFFVVAFVIALIGVVMFLVSQAGDEKLEDIENIDQATTPEASNSNLLDYGKQDLAESAEVIYFENTKGFLSKPKEQGEYPGVVMVHEWWGLNDEVKDMAKNLAAEGYIVLAVDLFGKVASTPEEARAQTTSLDQNKALENLKAATSYLKNNQKVTKVASLGWCFGGGQSLQLAVNDGPLDATVVYYGSVDHDKTKLANIKWPVLGIFGDKDTSIPVDKVNAFDKNLDELNVKNEIHIYPGVGHAFANPSGQNYAANETKDAWNKTLVFLEENLK